MPAKKSPENISQNFKARAYANYAADSILPTAQTPDAVFIVNLKDKGNLAAQQLMGSLPNEAIENLREYGFSNEDSSTVLISSYSKKETEDLDSFFSKTIYYPTKMSGEMFMEQVARQNDQALAVNL